MNQRQFCAGPYQDALMLAVRELTRMDMDIAQASAVIAKAAHIQTGELRGWLLWDFFQGRN